jgi:hypothetical protein
MHHEMFSRDPESAYSLAHQRSDQASNKQDKDSHDPDLKAIVSYVSSKEPIVTSLDVVKFLSETPLDEISHVFAADKVRKTKLGRELLALI